MDRLETDRLESTREILRRRRLVGLIVVASGNEDPNLAPFLRCVPGAGLGSKNAGRFGPCWLFIGLSGHLQVMPDSPWELGEVQRAGVQAVDSRLLTPAQQEGAGNRFVAFASSCGVAHGEVGIAGNIPAEVVTNLNVKAETAASMPHDQPTQVWLSLANDIPMIARRTKTISEVNEIQRVAGASDQAFLAVARLLAAAVVAPDGVWLSGSPVTVGAMRATVQSVFRRAGLNEPEGNLIAVGPFAAEPHCVGDDEHRVFAGESIVVDLFPRGFLFSDCTRTFCVGLPGERVTAKMVEAAGTVEAVKHLVEEKLKRHLLELGRAPAFDLQVAACEAFHRGGWSSQLQDPNCDSGYVHGLGHGLGERLHEAPAFSSAAAGTPEGEIRVGDVITIEPGLYQPGAWGVRFEDLYVVEARDGGLTRDGGVTRADGGSTGVGLKKLTHLPWALDPKEFLARVE